MGSDKYTVNTAGFPQPDGRKFYSFRQFYNPFPHAMAQKRAWPFPFADSVIHPVLFQPIPMVRPVWVTVFSELFPSLKIPQAKNRQGFAECFTLHGFHRLRPHEGAFVLLKFD